MVDGFDAAFGEAHIVFITYTLRIVSFPTTPWDGITSLTETGGEGFFQISSVLHDMRSQFGITGIFAFARVLVSMHLDNMMEDAKSPAALEDLKNHLSRC